MKYDVFISYSRKDYVDEQKNVIPGNEVSKIKEALTEAGITYWFDEEGIYSGQNFVEKIVTNIENSKIFLFLSTVNANKSTWTCKEIASADEFNKHIIPVRIDASPYNKKVLFRIADLDYIEYYTNPQKGMEDMIKSIQAYLAEFAAEEKRKKEEDEKRIELERKKQEKLKQQKELEEKRLKEKQEQLISEIKLACDTLNNAEAKLEIDRESLLLRAKGVTDNVLHDQLTNLIKQGGTIHQKYQKENSELVREVEILKSFTSEVKEKDNQILQLKSELEIAKVREIEQKKTTHNLIVQVGELQKKLKECPTGNKKVEFTKNNNSGRRLSLWGHVLYLCVIIIIGGYSFFLLNELDSWKWRYGQSEDELTDTQSRLTDTQSRLTDTQSRLTDTQSRLKDSQTRLETLLKFSPLIITDIEMANTYKNGTIETQPDSTIYSSNTMFFMPRIKYVGVKDGKNVTLYYKLFKPNGAMARNDSSSPTGYTSSYDIKVLSGENSQYLRGWGNEHKGYWPAGTYRIEIWYDGRILAEKTFDIH